MSSGDLEWGPWQIADEENPVLFGHDRLLLTDSGAPSRLDIEPVNRAIESVQLNSRSQIIASMQHVSASFEKERRYRLVGANRLCRILAFVDTALPSPDSRARPACFSVQNVPNGIAKAFSALEHWLPLEVMRGNTENVFLHHLRHLEAYRLTTYLLGTPGHRANLNELCVRYGVSYSHFRRLCHRTLGGSVKQRLREWRAARAMLDLVTGETPVLDVALDNGYASASHISNEIRQLFGITPRMAKNARALLP